MTVPDAAVDICIERPARSSMNQRIWDRAALALIAILSASYFAAAFELAATRPFWMDEILAVWAARLPTLNAVWDALNKGAEFSPPIYDFFLHAIVQLGGSSSLALRLPSIVAVYIVGIAAYILIRRRHSAPIAALAMALCLVGGLYPFAIQVRQYACVTACFAMAVVIWDLSPQKRPSLWRAAALLLLLAAAIGMHFYAVLLAATLGAMECAWIGANRRIRWTYVGAVALACASIFIWAPIMQHVMAFNSGDNGAPHYYARPLFNQIPRIYAALLIGHEPLWSSPLVVFGSAAVAEAALILSRFRTRVVRVRADVNLAIIFGIICTLPIGIFFFSFFVTHTFSVRYVIAAAFGFSIFTAQLVASLPGANVFACVAIAVSILASCTGVSALTFANSPNVAIKLINQAPTDLPIVTGNGLRFFELSEAAKSSVAHRLVFLTAPAGISNPDPTNEHQVERWKSIAPNLSVIDIDVFLKAHSDFLLFRDWSAVDLVPDLLAQRGYASRVIAHDEDAFLAEVTVGPVGHQN